MNYININPLHPYYNEFIQEGMNKGYSVACAQRPLPGIKTGEYDTIGNGRWFSYGSLEQFEDTWKYLDATIIKIITNEDIEQIVKLECEKEGIDIQDALSEYTMSELAETFELCYID